ncbi:MAG: hypothetical protein ACKVG1_07605 [Rhodospirillales bacterium]
MTTRLSIAIYLSIVVLGVANALMVVPHVAPIIAALIALFLILEVKNAPVPQAIVGLGLIAAGIISVYASGTDLYLIVDGFARGKTFLMVFFAVIWIRIPASVSPSIRATRRMIVNQPPGRRYLYLAVGVHFLGSVLNLAGLSLLSTMVERQKDPILRRRMVGALMIGFVSASAWSPFYVAMVVVLLAIPTLQWTDVAGWGAFLGAGAIFMGWLYDRVAWRKLTGASPPIVPAPLSMSNRLTVIAILGALVFLVIGTIEFAHLSLPVALSIIAPPYAVLWFATNSENGPTVWRRIKKIVSEVLDGVPELRNEALIFVGATVFGVGVSTLIPAADLTQWLDTYIPYVDLRIALLLYGMLAIAGLGLHAVIVIILVGEVLPPEVMGVPDWVLGISLLGIWGLSTLINPYSGTSLYLSRVTNISSFQIAWRWNPPMAFLLTSYTIATIILIRHLALL